MFATRVLRQAAAHAERTPSIRFLGRRTIPSSPTGKLPANFGNGSASPKHTNFSAYRDHAQQHGPLQRSISSGVGGTSGHNLGPVVPPSGIFFDRSELPARFRRQPLDLAEIEAVESGGAALFG
ncbi:ribosomal protein ymr-31 [Colletotrichum tofieldiae]|nr:ribosomal protein ymr-31 [Colletotrichum tofieldiae]GKT70665.1 ribosomal protein ymr-31 [Colletotrichum tofieldiae]